MSVALVEVEAALRARGLAPRGAFHLVVSDGVSALPDGRAVGRLVLAGNVGASLWARFARERRAEPEPLDRWSARVLGEIAARFDAAIVLPGDGPPRPPFLRWARRAEPVHPSPLGVLIHPDHGLWHAYRGALAFSERLALPVRDTRESPCTSCRERRCLAACPVGAFTTAGYDDTACAAHLESGAGAACFEFACLARVACPVARKHRYPPEQARFHLSAFLRGRRAAADRGSLSSHRSP
jgi:ferredoxin-like protein FixX